MKLTSIEISGFKSFADKTKIEFQDGLTGIVGPNGSGKSNIIEAIRWVLGEQSAKTLRGNKMMDVIFSGSKDRHALNRAHVSINFDNSDHFLDTPFTDLKISREVYRNGDSNYAINDKECRLKDITNLFMDSGMGEGSLSIISQGNVDAILNNNAEARRSIIETAAGVYKYKKQKNETEKKLTDTQENLERITDILTELEKQVGPLKEQSEDANHYLEKKKYLDSLNLTKLTEQVSENQAAKSDLESQAAKLKKGYQKLEAQVTAKQEQKAKTTEKIQSLSDEKEEAQNHLLEDTKRVEAASSEKKLSSQRLDFVTQRKNEINAQIEKQKADLEELKTEKSQAQEKVSALLAEVEKLKNTLDEDPKAQLTKELNSKNAELETLRGNYIDLMQELAGAKNDLRLFQKMSERNDSESRQKAEDIKRGKEQVDRLNKKREISEGKIKKLTAKVAETQMELEKADQKANDDQKKVEQAQKNWYDALRAFQETKTERDSIQTILHSHDALVRGTRNLLKNQDHLEGVKGAVGDFLDVPTKYVKSVEVALGGKVQQVVVSNVKAAQDAIKYLNKNKLGRVTFLPEKGINERLLPVKVREKVDKMSGFLGMANEVVTMPKEMESVKNHLLGNVLIVDSLKDAIAISNAISHKSPVVSLNGEIVNAGGSISGGTNRHQNDGMLTQKEKLKKLNAQVQNMQKRMDAGQDEVKRIQNNQRIAEQKRDSVYKQLNDCKGQLRLKEKELEVSKRELEKKERELKATQLQYEQAHSKDSSQGDLEAKINEVTKKIEQNQSDNQKTKNEIDALNHQLNQKTNLSDALKEKLIVKKEHLTQLKKDTQSLKENEQNHLKSIADLNGQLSELSASLKPDSKNEEVDIEKLNLAIKKTSEKIASLNEDLKSENKLSTQLDVEINGLQNDLIKKTEAVQRTEAQFKTVRANLLNYQQKLASLNDNLEEIKPVSLNGSALTSEIEKVNAEIEKLGHVNINAIDAYAEISERYEFMKHQLTDLNSSKTQLLAIMNKMDDTVKARFKATYDRIAVAFSRIFLNMFGGGEAKLKLEDPHHLLTTGIDILVKPPGKKYRNISLLSGGEKALTALVLLFAVLEVKPVPFVILDEAESALDPANVDRFARYMESLKKNTQFIVITHRKETMVYADQLYGVTMQDSGVSKVVSVDLDDSKRPGGK